MFKKAVIFTRPAPAHQNAPFRGLRRNEVHGAKNSERHVGGRRRGGEPAVSCRAVCVLGKAGGLFQHPDRAEVAELAYAHGSGPCGRKPVRVQVPASAPTLLDCSDYRDLSRTSLTTCY